MVATSSAFPESSLAAQAALKRAEVLARQNKHAEAAEVYREAIAAILSIGDEAILLANARLGLASCALRSGRELDEAVEACSAVLEADAADSRALFRRAMLRREMAQTGQPGVLAAAREDLCEAERLEPKNPRMRAARIQIEAMIERMIVHEMSAPSSDPWDLQRAAWLKGEVPQHRHRFEIESEDLESLQAALLTQAPPHPALRRPMPLQAAVQCIAALWGEQRTEGICAIGPQGPQGSDWEPVP